MAPPLEQKIRENGKVDLFCDMTDLHGWSPGGFWAELKFDDAKIIHASRN